MNLKEQMENGTDNTLKKSGQENQSLTRTFRAEAVSATEKAARRRNYKMSSDMVNTDYEKPNSQNTVSQNESVGTYERGSPGGGSFPSEYTGNTFEMGSRADSGLSGRIYEDLEPPKTLDEKREIRFRELTRLNTEKESEGSLKDTGKRGTYSGGRLKKENQKRMREQSGGVLKTDGKAGRGALNFSQDAKEAAPDKAKGAAKKRVMAEAMKKATAEKGSERLKLSPLEDAGDIGKRALHFADDLADDKEGTGIQHAWIDTASKGLDASLKVYSVSKSAKYYRMQKKDQLTRKLLKQEEKILKNESRLLYQSELAKARSSELWKKSNAFDRHLQKKAIKRRYMKTATSQYNEAKKKGRTAKQAYSTGIGIYEKGKAGVEAIIEGIKEFVSSKIGKVILIISISLIVFFALLNIAAPLFMAFLGAGTKEELPAVASFPEDVLKWREFVTERCEANNDPTSGTDLTLFVNAILATIWQESGGRSEASGGDLMQCKACGLWDDSQMPADWTTEQRSIDVGIRYFYQGLKTKGVTEASDYDGLQMVAQGYNYGFAFLGWASDNGYEKWDIDMSTAYSNLQASRLGWSSYGHKEYGQEWLLKYMSGGSAGSGEAVVEPGAGGVVKTAQNQIGICEDPAGSNNVVFNTDYYGREVSGSDYPWCCVFVWWCFDRSGNGSAFYGGEKTASCSAVHTWAQANGRFIAANEAQYGDIVLFGNNEHIEIVIKNNGDGTYQTIGGNTSSDEAGSQSNGGCVAIKNRSTGGKFPITSFIRPAY